MLPPNITKYIKLSMPFLIPFGLTTILCKTINNFIIAKNNKKN
jgi:hypothetical protein